jgi:hypothetical protein
LAATAATASQGDASSVLEHFVRCLARLAHTLPSAATPLPLSALAPPPSAATATALNPEVLAAVRAGGGVAALMALLDGDDARRLTRCGRGECIALVWLMLTRRRPSERGLSREETARNPVRCGPGAARRLVSAQPSPQGTWLKTPVECEGDESKPELKPGSN